MARSVGHLADNAERLNSFVNRPDSLAHLFDYTVTQVIHGIVKEVDARSDLQGAYGILRCTIHSQPSKMLIPARLVPQLLPIIEEKKTHLETTQHGRRCTLTLEYINAATLAKRQWSTLPTTEELQQIAGLETCTFPELFRSTALMDTLKLNDRAFSVRLTMANAICERPGLGEGTTVLGTLRYELVKNKGFQISRFLTSIRTDSTTSGPIELSDLTLIHQDPCLSMTTLQHYGNLFSEIITCPVSEVKERAATLTFLLSHASPYIKGNDWIVEDIERVLYWARGEKNMYHRECPYRAALTHFQLPSFLALQERRIDLNRPLAANSPATDDFSYSATPEDTTSLSTNSPTTESSSPFAAPEETASLSYTLPRIREDGSISAPF